MQKSVCALMLCLSSTAVYGQTQKLAVLPTQFEQGAEGVPKLFDDYLLAAVQNAGDFEVIGQDDIGAILGFEEQKDLLGCDDASCIADIGGALGVDRIVVVKIARLGDDWVSTAKLINIRETRVESRASDFVKGSVRDLLEAVPTIVGKLFGKSGGAPTATKPARASTDTKKPSVPDVLRQKKTFEPDPSMGRGARIGGVVMLVGGLLLAVSGAIGTTVMGIHAYEDELFPLNITTQALVAGGLLLTGIGSALYMNGRARAYTGDPRASGHHRLRWLAWLMAGASVVLPVVFGALEQAELMVLSSWAGVAGSGAFFITTMATSGVYAKSQRQRIPLASMQMFRNPDGVGMSPGVALSLQF